MAETKVGNLAGEAIPPIHKSFTKRYEQWKRTDLLAVAFETMPKQINRDKVLDNLLKLHREFTEDLSEET